MGVSRAAYPALALVVVVVYLPVLRELVMDWIRDANYRHGFLMPLIAAYLIWNKRDMLRTQEPKPHFGGLVGMVVSGLLLILGTAGAEVFTQRVSLILLLLSLVVFLLGWGHFRTLRFPLVFLFLAVPLPYVIYYGLTAPMQAFAAKCALAGLRGVGIPAVGQGNIIHLPQTSLEVVEACSGIRSLYAFLAVGALVASTTSVPGWARVLLFLTTLPLAVAGNAVRVWGSGVGAWLIGPEATRGAIHESFGVVVFGASLGVFILIRKVAGRIWSSAGRSRSSSLLSLGDMPPSSGPRPGR